MLILLWLFAVLVGVVALAYVNASGVVWSAAIAGAIAVLWGVHLVPDAVAIALAAVFILLAIPLNVPALRRRLASDPVLAAFRKVLPPMSQTEREAIEAGTVWWDGELFSGKPDWRKLLALPAPALSAEEMALAAGMPVPRLYLLRQEAGINAFAAGTTPGHSVVAVTRGALDRLTRDELQGVVAHELSHVLNADTRIDLRLMSAVGGLAFLTMLGRLLLDAGSRPFRSRDRSRGVVALVGLGLVVAGAFGSLCGRLVRYAVARQREWLADASAVQFTRNPDGLAGEAILSALKDAGLTGADEQLGELRLLRPGAQRYHKRRE